MGKTQPRPFSGEADAYGHIEDPAAWLEHYEDVCIMNGWTTDTEKIRNISIALTGEADTFYSINKSTYRTPGFHWVQFMATFIQRFRSANFIDELEEKVQNPVQKEGESIQAYYERYSKLCTQMGADAPPRARALKYWISG